MIVFLFPFHTTPQHSVTAHDSECLDGDLASLGAELQKHLCRLV